MLIEYGVGVHHERPIEGNGERGTTILQEAVSPPIMARAEEGSGMTPLHWAAQAGAMECAEILLQQGAPVDALNKARRTPLQLAAEQDQGEMIFLLASHGADLMTQDMKGRTPLHRATYQRHVDAAEALTVLGASTRVTVRSGKTPLQVARKACGFLKTG